VEAWVMAGAVSAMMAAKRGARSLLLPFLTSYLFR
jgi:hypothetical protein